MAAFDILMSIAPKWYSTIYGVNFWGSGSVGAFAALALIVLGIQRSGRLTHSVTAEHYHDIGKWMFAFTFFWAYTAFSQFMLQWYGNMPEETRLVQVPAVRRVAVGEHRDPRRLLGVPVRVPAVALDQAHRAVPRVLRGVAARVPLARSLLERDAAATTGRSVHGNARIVDGPADGQHRASPRRLLAGRLHGVDRTRRRAPRRHRP